jgi:adenosylhomocysteine nucleosidase
MTTAILSALAEEQTGLLDLLQNKERVTHAGRSFWHGSLHGMPVVLALSRIGKVAAATTATALIERFGVRRIVFTGVAGGIAPGVAVGDMVVANACLQHDMDASPLFPRYEVPLYARAHFATDTVLSAMLFRAAHTHIQRATGLKSIKIHEGLIASGDRFVSSALEATDLHDRLPNALCVEMEGAAVAQVCADYGIAFAAVRTISDRADDNAHVDFVQFIRDVAAPYAVGVVDELLKTLSNK